MGRSPVSGKRFVMPANLSGKSMPPPYTRTRNPRRQTIIGEEDNNAITSRERSACQRALLYLIARCTATLTAKQHKFMLQSDVLHKKTIGEWMQHQE